MLKAIKLIVDNAKTSEIHDPVFQKYIKSLIQEHRSWCKGCYEFKVGRYMKNKIWYCNDCLQEFNT